MQGLLLSIRSIYKQPSWRIWLVGSLTLLNGTFSILQILSTRFTPRPMLFTEFLPFGVHHFSKLLTLLFGFLLIYLSFHIFWRIRAAWYITIGLLIALAINSFFSTNDPINLVVQLSNVILLLSVRSEFKVANDAGSVKRALLLATMSVGAMVLYGILGFELLEKRDFGRNFSIVEMALRSFREYILIGNSDLTPHTRYARWFLDSLDLLGFTTALFALYSLFQPIAYRLATLPKEKQRAEQLLKSYGRTSLDYFDLWPDKSYFFSASNNAFIAYKVANSVAISLGDPIGPQEEIEGTIKAFLDYCSVRGWRVVFIQVLPSFVAVYEKLQFHTLKIGEEATVDVEKFCSQTVKIKDFRRVLHKYDEEGYTAALYIPLHPAELINGVERVSNDWLTLPGKVERTFGLGYFSKNYISEHPLFIVRNKEGAIVAFVNQIPSYRKGEATVDLMRHTKTAPNGIMDYLFAKLLLHFKENGYKTFNLGFVPLAGMSTHEDASLFEKAVGTIVARDSRFFSFSGLWKYKNKFEPTWEDRYIAYNGLPANLFKAAIAILSALRI